MQKHPYDSKGDAHTHTHTHAPVEGGQKLEVVGVRAQRTKDEDMRGRQDRRVCVVAMKRSQVPSEQADFII